MPSRPSRLASLRSSLMLSCGEAGQRLAVVQLRLLDQRQRVLLGILEPRQHRPQRGDVQRVRRDVLADLRWREVLRVDLHLLGDLRDVRDVDLHRAVAERLHELVVEELLVLGLVGVAEDDLVDVGLRELLRLDLALLGRAEQVVEERDVELQDLDELEDAAVGDVELAVEVERARIGVGAERRRSCGS